MYVAVLTTFDMVGLSSDLLRLIRRSTTSGAAPAELCLLSPAVEPVVVSAIGSGTTLDSVEAVALLGGLNKSGAVLVSSGYVFCCIQLSKNCQNYGAFNSISGTCGFVRTWSGGQSLTRKEEVIKGKPLVFNESCFEQFMMCAEWKNESSFVSCCKKTNFFVLYYIF